MATWAPRPAIWEWTPAAKYDPPLFVFHLPAALASFRRRTPLKTSSKTGLATRSRTDRPKSDDSCSLWLIVRISWVGCRPMYHDGNRRLLIRDFDDLGGRKIMRRWPPSSTHRWSSRQIMSMCRPQRKSGTIMGAIRRTYDAKSIWADWIARCFISVSR